MLSKNKPTVTKAIVLHRRAYRETSLIVDFLTKDLGRISAVVKGARKAKSNKKSLLQPFQPLVISLIGRSELKTLTDIEALSQPISLIGDKLYCAMYMNELITRVMPAQIACESLYEDYLFSLEQLAQPVPQDVVLRLFELQLLNELGVMPDFTCDQSTQQLIHEDCYYVFETEQGFVSTMNSSHAFLGRTLLDIQAQQWNENARRAAKKISRAALAPFIGHKPLHSRQLFKK